MQVSFTVICSTTANAKIVYGDDYISFENELTLYNPAKQMPTLRDPE